MLLIDNGLLIEVLELVSSSCVEEGMVYKEHSFLGMPLPWAKMSKVLFTCPFNFEVHSLVASCCFQLLQINHV